MPTTSSNSNASSVAPKTECPHIFDSYVGGWSLDRAVTSLNGKSVTGDPKLTYWASSCARDMLEQTVCRASVTTTSQKIRFVIVCLRHLGFTEPATHEEIIARALTGHGFQLCVLGDDPTCVRLHYIDQPDGEVVWVATTPIIGTDGAPDLFRLTREGPSLWLRGSYPKPPDKFDPLTLFLFRAPG